MSLRIITTKHEVSNEVESPNRFATFSLLKSVLQQHVSWKNRPYHLHLPHIKDSSFSNRADVAGHFYGPYHNNSSAGPQEKWFTCTKQFDEFPIKVKINEIINLNKLTGSCSPIGVPSRKTQTSKEKHLFLVLR